MNGVPTLKFDAVIVGGGPAGSATAIPLARAGWSVAIVERQRFPRRKVCGECLAASNLPLLHALGVGDAFERKAGAALRRVALLAGDAAAAADMPAATGRWAWGRALGRETLDGLLLEQAQRAGATVWQPWDVQAIRGTPERWQCKMRSHQSAPALTLHAAVLITANGSWEHLPWERAVPPKPGAAADLFAFKAVFSGTSHPQGTISVIALDGGYGGMVVAEEGLATLACCIRRDRLAVLRQSMPGLRAGDAVDALLRRSCGGVRDALARAERNGAWLAVGPLAPGIRVEAAHGIFRVGNAAGEAHPILGEGLSMALQSSVLLSKHLLGGRRTSVVPDGPQQAEIQRAYASAWRRAFGPRMRLAAVFAHLAMRPVGAAGLVGLARAWPGLLTQGARWGGKVRPIQWPPQPLQHERPNPR